MDARRWNKLAILAKLETTYGTSAAPVAANAILATNVTFTPIEAEEVSRDLLLPYMGAQGVVLAGIYGRIEFDVEIAGAGAAGDAPKYDPLLQMAGLAPDIDEDVSVTYRIIEDNVPSGSIYFISDKVQHVLLGCRANLAFSLAPRAIPRFRVTVIGMLGEITDIAAMPAVSQTGWTTPVTVSKANTTLSLHGWPAVAESVEVALGNTLTPRFLIGDEKMMISARASTGTVVVEARPLSDIDWFDRALKRTRGALALVHGTEAGNIVGIDAPLVEVGRPTQGQTDGIVNYSLPLTFVPNVGLDELTLTIR